MASTRAAVDIAAAPEIVFDWIENPKKVKRRIPGLERITFETGDPATRGSTFVHAIREDDRLVEYRGTITACHRPSLYELELGNDDFDMNVSYRLQDLGGRTRVEYACHLSPRNPVEALVGTVLSWFTQNLVERQLAEFRDLVEADDQ